nr:hypothetical protein [Salmonid herpesvirus 1]
MHTTRYHRLGQPAIENHTLVGVMIGLTLVVSAIVILGTGGYFAHRGEELAQDNLTSSTNGSMAINSSQHLIRSKRGFIGQPMKTPMVYIDEHQPLGFDSPAVVLPKFPVCPVEYMVVEDGGVYNLTCPNKSLYSSEPVFHNGRKYRITRFIGKVLGALYDDGENFTIALPIGNYSFPCGGIRRTIRVRGRTEPTEEAKIAAAESAKRWDIGRHSKKYDSFYLGYDYRVTLLTAYPQINSTRKGKITIVSNRPMMSGGHGIICQPYDCGSVSKPCPVLVAVAQCEDRPTVHIVPYIKQIVRDREQTATIRCGRIDEEGVIRGRVQFPISVRRLI